MTSPRILVTGAGSGVGQGIIKSLHASCLKLIVISADITPFNAALYRTKEALLIPKVEECQALEKIIEVIQKNKIDVVMVGSEFDLNFFAQNKEKIESETKALVIVSHRKTVEIADDKWLTAQFLKEADFPYPQSASPQTLEEALNAAKNFEFPFILKTRRGTSSKHVYIIEDEAALERYYPTVPLPMIQELLQKPCNELSYEYTCSIFKTKEGKFVGPFTARRTLRHGNSWVIEVDHFKEIYPLILKIGETLPIVGSFNVQLMKSPRGYIPFEFNARFSGTTAVRAHFGFNEPEMAVQNYFLHETIQNPAIRKGMCFRYLEEVFLEGVGEIQLENSFSKGIVKQWF